MFFSSSFGFVANGRCPSSKEREDEIHGEERERDLKMLSTGIGPKKEKGRKSNIISAVVVVIVVIIREAGRRREGKRGVKNTFSN